MANDSDWVADVRRWYFAREQAKVLTPEAKPAAESDEMGYEAAYPVHSRHWPDSSRSDFADLK